MVVVVVAAVAAVNARGSLPEGRAGRRFRVGGAAGRVTGRTVRRVAKQRWEVGRERGRSVGSRAERVAVGKAAGKDSGKEEGETARGGIMLRRSSGSVACRTCLTCGESLKRRDGCRRGQKHESAVGHKSAL